MIIVDAHEDIAWNILTFGRDYRRSVQETRRQEAGSQTPTRNGDTMLGWPEWVRGRVGLIFASLFAAPARRCKGAWDILCYADVDQAHRLYRDQLEVYLTLHDEQGDRFRLVTDALSLQQVEEAWRAYPESAAWSEIDAAEDAAGDEVMERPGRATTGEAGEQTAAGQTTDADLESAPPIGLVLVMEGAEGVRSPGELPEWYEAGVRIIGPSWAGTRYAGGTWDGDGFTREGLALLEAMAELGMILDLSHLSEEATLQALDRHPGPILASHSNARALVRRSPEPQRHLSDVAIRAIGEREGVVGIVLYNFFLDGEWRPSDGRAGVGLQQVTTQIDHVCQLTGSAAHVGLGSDFDGGFGLQGAPTGLDSVADLGLIGRALRRRGYSQQDIEAVLGGNWLRMLRRTLQGNS